MAENYHSFGLLSTYTLLKPEILAKMSNNFNVPAAPTGRTERSLSVSYTLWRL
jgi:hypothetical protein